MADITSMARAQAQRWSDNGDEVIRARGTVRLAQFKKSLPADLVVTVFDKDHNQYVPMLLWDGKPLTCGEVLPERADLALDERGRLLSQADFEARYDAFLASFIFPDGSDVGFEPIPNVVNYVSETPDIYSESNGMIPIRFDPRLNEDFKPKQRFGPNGETEEEWLRESGKNSADIASALQILAQNQAALTQFLMQNQNGTQVPISAPQQDAPAVGMTQTEAAEAAGLPVEEVAPCGAKIKRGYLKQHQRFCNAEDCGGKGENSEGPEAA